MLKACNFLHSRLCRCVQGPGESKWIIAGAASYLNRPGSKGSNSNPPAPAKPELTEEQKRVIDEKKRQAMERLAQVSNFGGLDCNMLVLSVSGRVRLLLHLRLQRQWTANGQLAKATHPPQLRCRCRATLTPWLPRIPLLLAWIHKLLWRWTAQQQQCRAPRFSQTPTLQLLWSLHPLTERHSDSSAAL